jgi:hypothetical protein
MMKKILAKFFASQDRVVFDDGSAIEYFNRETLMYTEANGRSIEIPFFPVKGKIRARRVYERNMSRWDPPNDYVVLSDQEKFTIERRLADYYGQLQTPFEFVRDV